MHRRERNVRKQHNKSGVSVHVQLTAVLWSRERYSCLLYSSYYKAFFPLNSSKTKFVRTRIILILELVGFPWRHGHGRTPSPDTQKKRKQKRHKPIDMVPGINSSQTTDPPPRITLHLRWQPTRSEPEPLPPGSAPNSTVVAQHDRQLEQVVQIVVCCAPNTFTTEHTHSSAYVIP